MIRACVVGDPVAHSRSPLIHGYWLAEHGIEGTYTRERVAAEALPAFLAALGDGGYAGCNVTIPHKGAAFRLARVDDAAGRRLEAVNTLWLAGEVLHGANTDVEGFLANLDALRPGWDAGLPRAVVLGAGGAARAVVHGLLARGAGEVAVVNRTRDRAQGLAALFGPQVRALGWAGLPAALEGASLLVNTTSLGMAGQPPLELDLAPLPRDALVADIVYVPLDTGLLRAARVRGNPVADGLGMLLHQAVPGFERWFGVRPAVTDALRRHVLAAL